MICFQRYLMLIILSLEDNFESEFEDDFDDEFED